MHWSALDWDAATLKVTHAVKRVRDRTETTKLSTRLVIGELKTARSRRTLPRPRSWLKCCAATALVWLRSEWQSDQVSPPYLNLTPNSGFVET